jgi:hypothetical protein
MKDHEFFFSHLYKKIKLSTHLKTHCEYFKFEIIVSIIFSLTIQMNIKL